MHKSWPIEIEFKNNTRQLRNYSLIYLQNRSIDINPNYLRPILQNYNKLYNYYKSNKKQSKE